jgi:DNA-binding transcriptional regulator YdaS (Cro superfamily)
MDNFQDLIKQAVDIVGSQRELAQKIGKSQQSVSHWINGASKIPAEDATAIEAATHGRITRAQLRPDLFKSEKRKK